MTYVLLFASLIIFQSTSAQIEQTTKDAQDIARLEANKNVARVKITRSGQIYLNKERVSFEALSKELSRIKSLKGVVWYYLEGLREEPTKEAIPVINAVTGKIIELELPVKLLEKDFDIAEEGGGSISAEDGNYKHRLNDEVNRRLSDLVKAINLVMQNLNSETYLYERTDEVLPSTIEHIHVLDEMGIIKDSTVRASIGKKMQVPQRPDETQPGRYTIQVTTTKGVQSIIIVMRQQ